MNFVEPDFRDVVRVEAHDLLTTLVGKMLDRQRELGATHFRVTLTRGDGSELARNERPKRVWLDGWKERPVYSAPFTLWAEWGLTEERILRSMD